MWCDSVQHLHFVATVEFLPHLAIANRYAVILITFKERAFLICCAFYKACAAVDNMVLDFAELGRPARQAFEVLFAIRCLFTQLVKNLMNHIVSPLDISITVALLAGGRAIRRLYG